MALPFTLPRILQSSQAQRLRSAHAARLRHYAELQDFYDGKHFPSGSRRGRSAIVANYARAIVDKHLSYLFARGLQLAVPPASGAEQLAQLGEATLARLAEDTALNLALLQAGVNAMVLGDAFLKVYWDAGRAQVRVLSLDPTNCFPTHQDDDPSTLARMDVCSYQADRSERIETWTAEYFQVTVDDVITHQGPNPYGFLPYIHVPNLSPPNTPWGLSDLEDLIPLNRELNERLSDQADVIHYHADPPVIFRGVSEHENLAVGPGTVWDIPQDAAVDLLEWKSQPPAVDHHLDRILRSLYDVTESPRTTFGDTATGFSGVALETQVQPVVQRTLRQRIVWTPKLVELARDMLRLAEQFDSPDRRVHLAGLRPAVVWYPMLPRDDAGEANRHLALVAGSLESATRAIAELGVLDAEREIAQITADRSALGLVTQATPAESQVRFVPNA